MCLDFVNEQDNKILENHSFPCLHSDGFCKPTPKHRNTVFWIPEEKCVIFHVSDFV